MVASGVLIYRLLLKSDGSAAAADKDLDVVGRRAAAVGLVD